MNLHLMKTSFQPDELADLQAIFDEIVSQPWFAPETKKEFAKYLFETLPASGSEIKSWRATIEASARMFYSRDA